MITVQRNEDILSKNDYNNDNIYFIFQFFIHQDDERRKEIKTCLKKNVRLGLFKKIIMLNERIYNQEELGLSDSDMDSIEQINIGKRLKYNDVFIRTKILKLNGYIVFGNADMFFDKTIENVRKTSLSQTKCMYSLLRFEYLNKNLSLCKLFIHPRTQKPRSDSQDIWIYHTTQLELNNELLKETDFYLGVPGCDNKITYVMDKQGYTCYNMPWKIKTYHYHTTQIRNYTIKDRVSYPYLYIEPIY